MKKLAVAFSLVALAGVGVGVTVAPRNSAPTLPICFSYHGNASVETFAIPDGTQCPSGYTYGSGTIENTAQLISILETVSKNNYQNGISHGEATVRNCILAKDPSIPIRSTKC
ncbi:MAG: hypothetical protein AABY37_06695 [Actinomycetota bacterium]